MKIIRVVLKDMEGYYVDGKLIYSTAYPDTVGVLDALGHEVHQDIYPRYRADQFRNQMPEDLQTVTDYVKKHEK